jgi:transcriptional antiterminator RfaH
MPQHEAAIAERFKEYGLPHFSPTYAVTRLRSDREKTLQNSASDYVLCRFTRNACHLVLNTPGVRSIVSFGGQPAVVPDNEIEHVAAMLDSGRPLQPWPYLDQSDKIQIERGPLKGVTAVVVGPDADRRLAAGVTFLRRSVCLSVDRESLSPICEEVKPRFEVVEIQPQADQPFYALRPPAEHLG